MSSEYGTSLALRVLQIEDDFSYERVVRRVLAHAGVDLEIESRTCLQDGIELMREKHFDVVLLDLGLPDSFGIDTVKRMLEEFSDVPMIVVTGSEDEEIAREAVELGIRNYLVKGEATGAEIIAATLEDASQSSPA